MFIRSNALSLLLGNKRCNRRALSWHCSSLRGRSHRSSSSGSGGNGGNDKDAAPNNKPKLALIFDTETTGMVNFAKPANDPSQPHLVQLGMILVDTSNWNRRQGLSFLVQLGPNVTVHPEAQGVHGISDEECNAFGIAPSLAARLFHDMAARADILVAHNLNFDAKVMQAAVHRELGMAADYTPTAKTTTATQQQQQQQRLCTMQLSTPILQIPKSGGGGKGYKWPSLQEAYTHFQCGNKDRDDDNDDNDDKECIIENAHNAMADAEACLVVFRKMVETGVIQLDDCRQQDKSKDDFVDQPFRNILYDEQASAPLDVSSPPPLAVAQPGELWIKLNGDGFDVCGNTYKYKETLKQMGAKWSHSDKAWAFSTRAKLDLVKDFAGADV